MIDYTLIENQIKLKALLNEKVMCVSFTKKNGEHRDLFCTLNAGLIPQRKEDSKRSGTIPTDSIAVFDTVNNGWRSFRWDSITNVTGE